jgi:putative oxidoreductase
MRNYGALVGRIFLALFFINSAIVMLFVSGVDGSASYFESLGLPMASLLVWLVLAIKLGAGGALVLGYRTEHAAWALIIFTALTILIAHRELQDPGLVRNLAIIGGLLYVVAYGPGTGWRLGR